MDSDQDRPLFLKQQFSCWKTGPTLSSLPASVFVSRKPNPAVWIVRSAGMFIQKTSQLHLPWSCGTLWDEVHRNPWYSGTRRSFGLLCSKTRVLNEQKFCSLTGYLRMQHSARCNYRNTLKQRDARQSQQRLLAHRGKAGRVGRSAGESTGGSSAAARGVLTWECLWSAPSLIISQEENTKLKSKRPKNKKSKWSPEEQDGNGHAGLFLSVVILMTDLGPAFITAMFSLWLRSHWDFIQTSFLWSLCKCQTKTIKIRLKYIFIY